MLEILSHRAGTCRKPPADFTLTYYEILTILWFVRMVIFSCFYTFGKFILIRYIFFKYFMSTCRCIQKKRIKYCTSRV